MSELVEDLELWLDQPAYIDTAVRGRELDRASWLIGRACDEIVALREALDESVKLQRHYALSLNDYDGGRRIAFESRKAWMDRLRALKDKKR